MVYLSVKGVLKMNFCKLLSLSLMSASFLGCQVQQTHIVRKGADGSYYQNDSSGYGYNPNYTSDQTINVQAPNAAAVVGVNAGTGGGSAGWGSMNGNGNCGYGGGVGVVGYGANGWYGGYYGGGGGYYGGGGCGYDPFTRGYVVPAYIPAGAQATIR